MILLGIFIAIILFILWTMLKCASIYDEAEENNFKKNQEEIQKN